MKETAIRRISNKYVISGVIRKKKKPPKQGKRTRMTRLAIF
jgi:hypothetical protein